MRDGKRPARAALVAQPEFRLDTEVSRESLKCSEQGSCLAKIMKEGLLEVVSKDLESLKNPVHEVENEWPFPPVSLYLLSTQTLGTLLPSVQRLRLTS